MADVKFEDYTIQVTGAIGDLTMRALEEATGELESAVKRKTAVDTGQTKNSWQHKVVGSSSGESKGVVGSNYQNAIWEEFGTGEYALQGNGRQGGWRYKDVNGDWHFTRGKSARRAFWKAYTAQKTKLIKHIQDVFKGGLS